MTLNNRNDMKILVAFTILSLISLLCCGQNSSDKKYAYDEALAKHLGGNKYGMKKYVMAFLKAGPTKLSDSIARVRLQEAHMSNISRMAEEGTLIIAGPFLDNQPIRGIYIFNLESLEEAKKLTETDPAIKAGTLEMELHPWYGSAALQETFRIHKSIVKP